MATKVGAKMASPNFILRFRSANQNGKPSQLLEEYTDWKGVMKVILATLENHPTNTETFLTEAKEKLEKWAFDQEGGAELQLKIRVYLINRLYYRQDQTKFFSMYFTDVYRTSVTFDIRKKNKMTSLKTLAARKISGCILNKDDAKTFEIPRNVVPDIEEAFDDSWRVKYINTSAQKRKITELSLNDLRKKKDCPYCGRQNFKKIITHVMRTDDCHVKYKTQLEYNYVVNKCFW